MGLWVSMLPQSVSPSEKRCMLSHPQLHTSSQSSHAIPGGGHLCFFLTPFKVIRKQEQNQFLELFAQYPWLLPADQM